VLHLIFDHPDLTGVAVIAAKTTIVYAFLIIGLRVLGKRELGQMSLYDLVLIVILGNAVQNAMINNDNTLGGGLVAAAVLLIVNRGFNQVIARSKTAERYLIGEPVLLVNDGKLLRASMEREGITNEQLEAALREHGFDGLADVHMVVLEVDGTMSVISRKGTMHRTRRHYRGLRLP
jgi:uncharacterized membrane protein YcaP (DUF421 family)